MSQFMRNLREFDNEDCDEANLNHGLINEFNEESAQKRKRPAVSIEKMIIKDGETIHLNRPPSPKLMGHNNPPQSAAYLPTGFNNIGPEAMLDSRCASANTTSERLLNYGKQIHLKRQLRAEEQIA